MPASAFRVHLLALAIPLLAACRTAGQRVVERSERRVVEPSERTVVHVLERAKARGGEDVLWVTNRSSLPIVVVDVTLHECENVGQPCDEPVSLFVRVDPGERKPVLRIRPAQDLRPADYKYGLVWRKADALDPSR